MGLLHRARWGPTLAGFLDDELDRTGTARVLRHLEECPDCVRDVERLAQVQQSLARLVATH